MKDFFTFLNLNVASLIAGLLGATVTMLRKSDGTLQARLIGYVTAIITIIYLLPFLVWVFDWKFQIVLHSAAENMLSFVCGMIAQRLTESFVDDPMGTLEKIRKNSFRLKRILWNGETLEQSKQPSKEDTDNKEGEK